MYALLGVLVLLPCLHALPSLTPLSYDLLIRLPDGGSNFTASLSLHLQLQRRTNALTLHASHLHSFHNVSLVSFHAATFSLKAINFREENVTFVFDELDEGEYVLHVGEYSGEISDGSSAIFRRGQSLFTHLQPSFARRVLPCVDEPSVKAPFRLSLQHSLKSRVYSNTAAIDERMEGGRKRTTFAPTPALPAYLLAFSLVPQSMEMTSAQTSFGVTVRVVGEHPPSLLRVMRVALNAFHILARIFILPLPLNKMDIVLVSAYDGGMENWGHILLSSSIIRNADDAHVVHLVAHELAHHWIGNLATVHSWAHICLQEDLADMIAYKVVKEMVDERAYDTFRLAKYVEVQLAEDVVSPGHSLLLPQLINPQMIWSHCYLKGVIHLEQMERVIGEEKFMKILRSLVTHNETFSLSTFTHLLHAHNIQGNISLGHVFEHYFTVGGFPALDVAVDASSLRLQQSSASIFPLLIPLPDGREEWMFSSSLSLPYTHSSPSSVLPLVNSNFTSFFRVNYDNATWNAVLDSLQRDPTAFSPVTRAQIITDLCFFSTSFADPLLVDRAMDIVYSQPQHFDLCDWTLLWCRHSLQMSASTILQRALVNLSSMFTSASDYKCRSGEAIFAVNRLCMLIFGKQCI